MFNLFEAQFVEVPASPQWIYPGPLQTTYMPYVRALQFCNMINIAHEKGSENIVLQIVKLFMRQCFELLHKEEHQAAKSHQTKFSFYKFNYRRCQ
jgi:hypothetical protein